MESTFRPGQRPRRSLARSLSPDRLLSPSRLRREPLLRCPTRPHASREKARLPCGIHGLLVKENPRSLSLSLSLPVTRGGRASLRKTGSSRPTRDNARNWSNSLARGTFVYRMIQIESLYTGAVFTLRETCLRL